MDRYAGCETPSGVDVTMLPELHLDTRDARREDVGAMANIFLSTFRYDRIAQLLCPLDRIWPVVVEMLHAYLEDDCTHVILAKDGYTDTTVGWTSVNLVTSIEEDCVTSIEEDCVTSIEEDCVTSIEEDFFRYCDSIARAGGQLVLREAWTRNQAPIPIDELKRLNLISIIREHNYRGQYRHANEQRLVINTIAIRPDVCVYEIPEIAHVLVDHIRNIAKKERLPIWTQVPTKSPGDLGKLYEETGFSHVGSFGLPLLWYTNEEHRRRRNWGFQNWTQWVLRVGDWERG